MKRIAVLYNPSSRNGHEINGELIRDLADEYEAKPVFIKDLKKGTDFAEDVQQAIDIEPDIIIVAGGDGTVRAAVQAMHNSTDIPLLIWPTGTANILAKNLGLTPAAEDIFALIQDGEVKPLHVGLADDKVFTVGAAIGISTKVFENIQDEIKGRIGNWAYLAQGVVEFSKHKAFTARLKLHDGSEITFDSHQVTVLNGNFSVHEFFNVFPKHNVFEKGLNIHTHAETPNKVLHLANAIREMQQGASGKYIKTWHVQEAILDAEPAQIVSLDAEIVSQTPVRLSVSQTPIMVVVPRE